MRIQETPDVVPDGQTPHTVSCSVYDELVDCGKPGDRVELVGVWRCVGVRVDSKKRTMKRCDFLDLFSHSIDVAFLVCSRRIWMWSILN
jgi:DNA replicative helicase MCM subunit Mcm2 (Cdc46/Mcm family)